MATAFTTYTDGTVVAAASGGNYAGTPVRTVLTGHYDSTRRNMTVDADTMAVVNIPAGTWVEAVILEIVTPETSATPTISVGDGDGTSSWVAGVSTDAAAGTKYLGAGAYAIATGTSQTNGKFYATADTIDLLMPAGDDATTLVCKIHVICTIV